MSDHYHTLNRERSALVRVKFVQLRLQPRKLRPMPSPDDRAVQPLFFRALYKKDRLWIRRRVRLRTPHHLARHHVLLDLAQPTLTRDW